MNYALWNSSTFLRVVIRLHGFRRARLPTPGFSRVSVRSVHQSSWRKIVKKLKGETWSSLCAPAGRTRHFYFYYHTFLHGGGRWFTLLTFRLKGRCRENVGFRNIVHFPGNTLPFVSVFLPKIACCRPPNSPKRVFNKAVWSSGKNAGPVYRVRRFNPRSGLFFDVFFLFFKGNPRVFQGEFGSWSGDSRGFFKGNPRVCSRGIRGFFKENPRLKKNAA